MAGTPPSSVSSGGAGALTQLVDGTLGGAAVVDLTAISGAYNALLLIASLRATNAGGVTVNLTVNGDTSGSYFYSYIEAASGVAQNTGSAATAMICGGAPGSGDTAGRFGDHRIHLIDYANTARHKSIQYEGGRSAGGGAANQVNHVGNGTWANTAAITQITLTPSAGATWVVGCRYWLYGVL